MNYWGGGGHKVVLRRQPRPLGRICKLTRNKKARHIFPHHYFPVAMIGIICLHMHFVLYTWVVSARVVSAWVVSANFRVGRFGLGRWVVSAHFRGESFRTWVVSAKVYRNY